MTERGGCGPRSGTFLPKDEKHTELHSLGGNDRKDEKHAGIAQTLGDYPRRSLSSQQDSLTLTPGEGRHVCAEGVPTMGEWA